MDENKKTCPFCGGEININAVKCKHCKEFINTPIDTTNGCISGVIIVSIIFVLCVVFAIDFPTANIEENKSGNMQTCAFEVAGVCYGYPFIPPEVEYNECLNIKDELGINICYAPYDNWVGAVKACGGVKNLPTPDELASLATDLYGTKIVAPADGVDYIYGLQRNNNKEYLDVFRDMKYTEPPKSGYDVEARATMPFALWSGKERDRTYSYSWSFNNYATSFNDQVRSGNNSVYASCVISRKN